MKNYKGEELKQPYLDLARMRRAYTDETLSTAFDWTKTNEGLMFWHRVWEGYSPSVPDSSMMELEAWKRRMV